jgi:hypothetical protein
MFEHTALPTAIVRSLALSLLVAGLATGQQRPHSRLVLQIHSVKCLDETNGKYMERIGGDEIVLSGIAVDAGGHARRVPTMKVGYFRKDKEVKQFSPARELASFDLSNGPDFPRTFKTYLVLVERDEGGGFGPMVDRLVARVNDGKSVGPVGDGQTGVFSERDIRRVLTAAAKGDHVALAKAIGGTIKIKLGDDIFPPQLVERKLGSATALFSGGRPTTGPEKVSERAHGGRYEITYSWRLVD